MGIDVSPLDFFQLRLVHALQQHVTTARFVGVSCTRWWWTCFSTIV